MKRGNPPISCPGGFSAYQENSIFILVRDFLCHFEETSIFSPQPENAALCPKKRWMKKSRKTVFSYFRLIFGRVETERENFAFGRRKITHYRLSADNVKTLPWEDYTYRAT